MPKVSIFKNVENVQNPLNMELQEYLEHTRDGFWEDITTKCRLLKGDERKAFKKTMPTTTLSGEFTYRADNGLVSHSGIIAIDLDHVQDLPAVKRVLENDKYVLSVFMSTSGDGLRVLFKIDPKKHQEAFRGISTYLYEQYGLIADPNGVNVSKPYIVSFDPYLYINMDWNKVSTFKRYPKETPIKRMTDFVHTAGDFEKIMKQITGRCVNICEEYQDWLKVGFAICEQFGEAGRGYFHDVSRFSPKYRAVTTDKQYDACMKARGTTKVNISTFYYLAKIHNISIVSEQTRTIVRTTKNGKKAGLKKEQIVENLKKFSNITNADTVVDKIFEEQDDNEFSTDEESILYQLELFISNNYSLKMNEVTGYLEQNEHQLSPSDLNSIFIAAKKLIPKLDYNLMIRLLKSDFIETYNPFFKFFGSDGIPVMLPAIPLNDQPDPNSPLIDLLASCIKNEKPAFTLFFLRKWLVSVVSAAHKVHSPLLLCLLGSQNTGKTEFFRRLLPKELSTYYAESKLDKEKDDELLMTENLIIMDDELGGKSKQDALKLKNITSKQYFSLRRPYGDHNEKILRLAVLCGTSNYNEILSDPTGNRRIIPIEVIDIDKELYNSIDKRDLFMEAFRLYKEGFDWRIGAKDVAYLNTDSVKYEQVVKERELIDKYFKPGDDVRLSSTEILVEIEILTHQRLNLSIIGREMERLKFDRKTTRVGGATPKKWCVIRTNRDQAAAFNNTSGADKIKEEDNKEDLPF
jgi:hypothetical protein